LVEILTPAAVAAPPEMGYAVELLKVLHTKNKPRA
jgi:hypothetical protein